MAYSKAAKRRAKRGRPRLAAAGREPNGRLSRRHADQLARGQEAERAAMSTAINARIRHEKLNHNIDLTEDQARDEKRGSVLGLMLIDETITPAQYEAGKRFAGVRWRYFALTGVPFPSARAQLLGRVHGFDGELSETRIQAVQRASNEMMRVDGWISCIGASHHTIRNKLDEACFQDIEQARTWPEHTLNFLRRGLNELVFKWALEGDKGGTLKRLKPNDK